MYISSLLTYSLFLPFQFLLILALPSLGLSLANLSSKCIPREREALLAIKKGLTDPSGRLSSWDGEDCCKWEGIGCSNDQGNVIRMSLRNPYRLINGGVGDTAAYKRSCLGGKIDPSLLDLKYLSYLDLSMNDFEGLEVPEFFGELKYLQYLNLSFASFSGLIPPHLGNLSRLQFLDLYADSFSYSGTSELYAKDLLWVSGLSSLKHLNLNSVKLQDVGTNWLQIISTLPFLEELHLHWCKLPSPSPTPTYLNFPMLSVLDLSENSFGSSIPSWLFNLTSLRKLYLRWNFFTGSIPSELANLKSLQVLDLASNLYLEGQIPGLFGRLSKLKILDLSGNNFKGEIQEFLDSYSEANSNSLESLDLSSNNLVGNLPDSIGILKHLKYLLLSGNSFGGSIPTSIGNLLSLKKLDLSSNLMSGTIPESFGKLSELVEVNLILNSWEDELTEAHLINLKRLETLRLTTDRRVVFKVSSTWLPPFKLKSIQLENCLVGPAFPLWLQSQTDLKSVTLKNAGISAVIPEEWFSKLSSDVIRLDLSKNSIRGKLPYKLEFQNLNFIDLSSNNIEGPLPLWSMNVSNLYLHNNLFYGSIPENIDSLMPRLQNLYLFGNNLSGRIPVSLCNMAGLQILSLRDNHFSGELPNCWHNSWTLWGLDISRNRLSGKIPSSIGNLPSLAILMLRDNNLHGDIPSSLQNRSGLTSIDLGRNNLSGSFPLWIGENFPSLFMLRLDSNLFTGDIPYQLCNLRKLHILDLSQNKLSGQIPKCLHNLTSLVYGNNSMVFENQIKIVRRDITIAFANSFNLSGNNLIKGIPDEMTSLAALEVLDLSRNQLSDGIPEKIGDLKHLKTVDLSHNNLSGQIPRSLGSLTYLLHLNLSFNNLTGTIPAGLEKFSDSSIYEGNPLLCGIPLPRKCQQENKHATPT